jgi:UDP-N-acetylmuramoylalanine--D-glutamate ligase
LRGWHNVQNIMAAIAATESLVTNTDIQKIVSNFKGIEHRLEFCGKIKGAICINDSIATTPYRTMAGIKSFTGPIVLIAGGADKGLNFTDLARLVVKRVKCLIVMGETGPQIKNVVLRESTKVPIKEADGLESAMRIAAKLLQTDDVLLFSPASASFDRYKNFEERGEHFKLMVDQMGDRNCDR